MYFALAINFRNNWPGKSNLPGDFETKESEKYTSKIDRFSPSALGGGGKLPSTVFEIFDDFFVKPSFELQVKLSQSDRSR
jgi:hypothetical protein